MKFVDQIMSACAHFPGEILIGKKLRTHLQILAWSFLLLFSNFGKIELANAMTSSEIDEEFSYQRGSIALSQSGHAKWIPFAALGLIFNVVDGFRFACSDANPELTTMIDEVWGNSKLGQLKISINGRDAISPDHKILKDTIGSTQNLKGIRECRFFGAYLKGVEESLPSFLLEMLGMPLDQSPYEVNSKNPILRIKIGHAGPTSGSIAHLGQENQNAAQMAIDDLNARSLTIRGKPVRFMLVWVDDAADPARATEVANKLIAAGARAVVGHLNSGLSIPASKVYADAGVPQVSPSSTNPWLTKQGLFSVFRMVMDDESLGLELAKYAKNVLGVQRVSIIRDGTVYGNYLVWSFDREAYRSNMDIVYREATTDKSSEFKDIVQKLKDASPELVFFGGMDAVAGPLLREMRVAGIQAKFMGGDGICTQNLPEASGGATGNNQVFCAEAGGVGAEFRKSFDAFNERYRSKFGKGVEAYAPYAYDATMLIADAMLRAESSVSEDFLPYLKTTSGFKGITGIYNFDQHGDPVGGHYTVFTYREGKRMVLGVGP